MSFLDSLKEIGVGNTGPMGRMRSGATNLNNYVQQRQGLEAERGVTQALALATDGGKELTMTDYIDISDKWGVPLNELIQRGQGINNAIFAQKSKTKLKAAWEMYQKDKKQPGFNPDEKYVMSLFQKVGITDPRIMGMFKDSMVKLQDKKSYHNVPRGANVHEYTALGGLNPVPVATGQEVPVTEKMDEASLLKRANAGDKDAARVLAQQQKRKMERARAGTEAANLKSGKEQLPPAIPTQLDKDPRVTEETARQGTGFWANMAAGFDALAGGVGLTKLFGKDRAFAGIQDARQQLKILKQTAKSAFLNSGRGPIWEQQKIDGLFPDPDAWLANPATEAAKLPKLRRYLLELKESNDASMRNALDYKELQKYRAANQDVNRILDAIGTDNTGLGLSSEAQDWLKKKGY